MPKIQTTSHLKNRFRHLHLKGMPYPVDSYSTKLLMYQEEASKSAKSRDDIHEYKALHIPSSLFIIVKREHAFTLAK